MSAILFNNIKNILLNKYNVTLYDWHGDWDARKGNLRGKISHRHVNDSLDGLDDERIAEMFAGYASTYGGNTISISGVSVDGVISPNPFVYILNKKKNEIHQRN